MLMLKHESERGKLCEAKGKKNGENREENAEGWGKKRILI
jgi:hypothetical protein